ncbi:hypothetical protein JYT61_01060 [bacterium AH-315-E10]|nr:hypothetical protein [bacterium AH-315-E10]
MTHLEKCREEMGLEADHPHTPDWRIERVDDDFTWIFDGDRGVALIHLGQKSFELRVHGPQSDCPPAIIPKHYHVVSQVGARILYEWRLKGQGHGDCKSLTQSIDMVDGLPQLYCEELWEDHTISKTTLTLSYNSAWGAYVIDGKPVLDARYIRTSLEYCNILPAGIGDSRNGMERHPHTYWKHPDGYRKLLKNPLWFNSVGAQDLSGEKHIEQGGFIGFGPDPVFNPVIEIVSSDPETGATTCDNLQDEHIICVPAEGRHAATGWFHIDAHYRFFSIPQKMAESISSKSTLMKPGAMLPWKFQYPPTPELPRDLSRVELPGSPFYGPSDWSTPIPWDEPYNGLLWTASPEPEAAIHYDRTNGFSSKGSIRLRVDSNDAFFSPGSGHTLHLDEGVRYRASIRIKTEGDVRAHMDFIELLFNLATSSSNKTEIVGPDCDWTLVEVECIGKGDDFPFATPTLQAEGTGMAWFCDYSLDIMK